MALEEQESSVIIQSLKYFVKKETVNLIDVKNYILMLDKNMFEM